MPPVPIKVSLIKSAKHSVRKINIPIGILDFSNPAPAGYPVNTGRTHGCVSTSGRLRYESGLRYERMHKV